MVPQFYYRKRLRETDTTRCVIIQSKSRKRPVNGKFWLDFFDKTGFIATPMAADIRMSRLGQTELLGQQLNHLFVGHAVLWRNGDICSYSTSVDPDTVRCDAYVKDASAITEAPLKTCCRLFDGCGLRNGNWFRFIRLSKRGSSRSRGLHHRPWRFPMRRGRWGCTECQYPSFQGSRLPDGRRCARNRCRVREPTTCPCRAYRHR